MKPTQEMLLVDYETQTVIGFGTEAEMLMQLEMSHGNLFVVPRKYLTNTISTETEK